MMIRYLIFFYFISNAVCICNESNWWKFTEIYEIFISSFKDSNGDGIGDLKGITSKLDHFVDLKIDSIWITPFFDSPKVDMGYDIRNYTAVDPVFGTLADFEELSKEAEKRGIKVIIDFVINHSSDEHIWFQKSIDKIKPYDEYYVWKDPKGYDKDNKPIPPNNWLSWFDGIAWEWNTKRKQFYLHQFGRKQPDLNLRNEKVIKELKDVLVFWFNRGVSGMRFDASGYYIEDAELRDESLLNENTMKTQIAEREHYTQRYTKNLPESYEVVHEFRVFIDELNKKRGGYNRIIVAEDYANLSSTVAYYGTEEHPVTHYPFNFDFARASDYFSSASLHSLITTWLESIPNHGVPTWNAENHDRSRIGSRFVAEYARLMNILIMLLPGVPGIYYGQEICMVDGVVRPDQEKDYIILPGTTRTRDLARTPMQWDGTLNAGFTSSIKTWLPVDPSFWRQNVELQKNTEKSCLNIFKELSRLRKTKTCRHGNYNGFKLSTWVYAFTRTLEEHDTYVVVMNLGTEFEMVNLHAQIPNLKVFLRVLVATENSGYNKGDVVKVKSKFPHIFVMKPFSAIVFLSVQSSKINEIQISDYDYEH